MDTCRILLVDADPLFCCGMQLCLTQLDGTAVVAQTGCAYQALALTQRLQPDLILVGEVLPGLSGRTLAVALSSQTPRPRVILLTTQSDPSWLQRNPGVCGELGRDLPLAQLLAALMAVQRDGAIPGQVILRLLSGPGSPQSAVAALNPGAALPSRLLQILDCLLLGYSVRTTSNALGIAEQTVKNRTAELLRRLDARDRLGVVRLGVAHGWATLGRGTAERPAVRPAEPTTGVIGGPHAAASRCVVRQVGGKAARPQIPAARAG